MQTRFILTDGKKAADILSDDPSIWTQLGTPYRTDNDTYYAKVSAAFRAYNLKANVVASVPFILYKGETEFDNSATWENKVGFLPNPQELLRLDTLSYMATNTIYNVRTSDVLGYKTKGLYHAVPYSFYPVTHPSTNQLVNIERRIGATVEIYQPEDKRLVRMWRLDHTTEVLPSLNTEAQAIANAAGVAYFADAWIKHFFERGGVAPTVIAMKGAANTAKRDDEEKSWKDWVLGFGRRFRWNPTRVVNAEMLDVKQFGSSVTEFKDNNVYQQALSNIAMGIGMPLSLLLANSANYATAREEKSTWFDSDIIPFCNWLEYEYNRQVFVPLGLRMQFQPQTLDPEQEDETEKAQAFSVYGDTFAKYPTYGLWRGMANTIGLEVSDDLDAAAQEYYADRKQQMEQAQAAAVQSSAPQDQPPKPPEPIAPPKPAKFLPNLDQIRELQRWQELCFRKFKRGESLAFEWRNDTLPEEIHKSISEQLSEVTGETGVKAAFDFSTTTETLVPEYKSSDLILLADALNNFAAKEVKEAPASPPVVVVNNQRPRHASFAAEIMKNAFSTGVENVRPDTNQ